MFRRTRHTATVRLPDDQLRIAWQVCSLLLDYPTETLVSRLGLVRQAVGELPAYLAEPVCRLADHLAQIPLGRLQRDYVETFDHTRRGCLYLTYFTAGDTRKRGVALVQLKQAYRRSGVELNSSELPDHLGVVLEFGATADVDAAWRILNDYRASLEVLRVSLQEKQSPWADAVVAVSRTLPELVGDDAEAIARLIEQGPPAEDVGLAPYAVDPRLNPYPWEAAPPMLPPSVNPLPDYLDPQGAPLPVLPPHDAYSTVGADR